MICLRKRDYLNTIGCIGVAKFAGQLAKLQKQCGVRNLVLFCQRAGRVPSKCKARQSFPWPASIKQDAVPAPTCRVIMAAICKRSPKQWCTITVRQQGRCDLTCERLGQFSVWLSQRTGHRRGVCHCAVVGVLNAVPQAGQLSRPDNATVLRHVEGQFRRQP